MKNALTPYKNRNTMATNGGSASHLILKRSGSSMSVRSGDQNQPPTTPMVRKKNQRNLMILGSSSSAAKVADKHFQPSQYFSLKETQAYWRGIFSGSI